MTMTCLNNRKNDSFILSTIDELVPLDHKVRELEEAIDWNFIYPLVRPLYSSHGRPSIDPVVLFKMIFINFTFGIHSMRRTCEEIKVNLAYRWFLGLSIEDEVPNYSTWSQNYIRRYGDSEVFDCIFNRIIEEAITYDFVDLDTIFGDGTHRKAHANNRKHNHKVVEITKKYYDDELLEEINKDRQSHNKKPLKETKDIELIYDENTGELIEGKGTKMIKVSQTYPESGCFHKGEKQKCFAYTNLTFCERHGFVLHNTVAPGNMHDSVIFHDAYQKLKKQYGEYIQNISLDAGFFTPAICREVIEDGVTPYLPYKRPMTKKGFLKKYEYVYDEKLDIYICPNIKELKYTTTNKSGYKEYRSNPKDCENCPYLNQCTQSQKHQKVIMRHIWEEYREEADEIRHTPKWKEIYPQRKETIERVYADCKEKHGLRFTRVKGLQKNQHESLIIFGCHNLSKLARMKKRRGMIKPSSTKKTDNQENKNNESDYIFIKKYICIRKVVDFIRFLPLCQQSEVIFSK